MSTAPEVLTVCTANICRSPAAERLLADLFGPLGTVGSAGVRALPGSPACDDSQAWVSRQFSPAGRGRRAIAPSVHSARPLTPDLVRRASLVLTATRDHRAAVIRLMPAAQGHTFTLAQAARIAGWQLVQGARPAPGAKADVQWLVDTLHAGRTTAPRPDAEADDDLLDPHEGECSHDEMFDQLAECVLGLARLLHGAPAPAPTPGP